MSDMTQTHNPIARTYYLPFRGDRAGFSCECGAESGGYATIEEAEVAAHNHQDGAIRDRIIAQLVSR